MVFASNSPTGEIELAKAAEQAILAYLRTPSVANEVRVIETIITLKCQQEGRPIVPDLSRRWWPETPVSLGTFVFVLMPDPEIRFTSVKIGRKDRRSRKVMVVCELTEDDQADFYDDEILNLDSLLGREAQSYGIAASEPSFEPKPKRKPKRK